MNNCLNDFSERVGYLDVVRSIGLILMVAGHVFLGKSFDFYIHAFHMPIFFIVSGYFFTYKNQVSIPAKKYILKKMRSLLLPYLCFIMVSYCVLFFERNFDISQVFNVGNFKYIFFYNTTWLPKIGALWFLTALFITDILYYLINKYIKGYVKYIVIILLSLFANYNLTYFHIKYPWAMNAGLVGLTLFLIGSMIRNGEVKNNIIKKLFNLHLFTSLFLMWLSYKLIFQNSYINMRSEKYGTVWLFWVNVIIAYIWLVNISKHILVFCKSFKLSLLSNWLLYIGKNSIVFLCLNQILIASLATRMFKNNLIGHPRYVKICCVLLALTALSVLINNTKLKFLIGKK